MIRTPRPNKLIEQKKNPEQTKFLSPTSKVRSPNNRMKQLSPNFDNRSNKSKHSRHSNRSDKSFRSFQTIYSRQMLSKHEPCHLVGYNEEQIKSSIDYIFQTYDSNKNDLLDGDEVYRLVRDSLKHIGSKHEPTKLEIAQFIQHIDKNNDGKLSRLELQKTFLRASKSLN